MTSKVAQGPIFIITRDGAPVDEIRGDTKFGAPDTEGEPTQRGDFSTVACSSCGAKWGHVHADGCERQGYLPMEDGHACPCATCVLDRTRERRRAAGLGEVAK